MDFELALKAIVTIGAGGFVFLMLGLGVKMIFFRRKPVLQGVDPGLLEALEDRLERTESKVVELEERLDFTERMLAEARNRAQLPGS
ncbi:MAG TPA: hypothetical protein VFM23_03665 [Gemmatimonadales bacterium]|nr:hypothetical protein [Gemmatimonadales bacterium]